MTAEPLEVGALVARQYRVVRRLGSGLSGSVYEVENETLPGQRLALKVLRPDPADPAGWRERFQREALILSDLRHPRIVTIRHYFASDDVIGFTMDLAEGPTLAEVLRDGPLELPRALRRVREVLEGLAAAHGHAPPIVHRDVKPQNVVIERPGTDRETARILDFGIAKRLGGAPAAAGLTKGFIGSPPWASPEQCDPHRPIDHRADLYSVGCMLFEAATGRRPFWAQDALGYVIKHLRSRPPTLGEAALQPFPEALERVVARALEKEPDRRFQDAAAMMAAIDGVLASLEAADGSELDTPHTEMQPEPPVEDTTERVNRSGVGLLHTGGEPGADEAASAALETPTRTVSERTPPAGLAAACLEIEGDRALRRVFCVSGTSLSFGRSPAPDRHGRHLVLRALPCRSAERDPAEWALSRKISNLHGRIVVDGPEVAYEDSSSQGTIVDGHRLSRGGRATLDADEARIDLAGDALRLRVSIARRADGDVRAVVIRRASSAPEHAYVLCVSSFSLGDAGADLPLDPAPSSAVTFTNEQGALAVGALIAPGWALRLGAVEMRVEEPTPERFTTLG